MPPKKKLRARINREPVPPLAGCPLEGRAKGQVRVLGL